MSDPRPKELIRFLELLLEDAPDGYDPWLFRVEAGSKAPDLTYGSWKKERARLTKEEAIRWMESGGNVGIAGTDEDALVNVDIDDEDETTPEDLKDTLIARSRSRTGVHAWYFADEDADIPNIPTDDAGEVRTDWQYVVAPGSYVETDPEEVPEHERDMAGYYSVEREQPVASLSFDELPNVFQRATRDEPDVTLDDLPGESGDSEDVPTPDSGDRDGGSALFDISAEDVASRERGRVSEGDRWTAIFHGSDTGKNMSLSSRGLLQCWRHEVTHNGLQALTVLSDYSGGCQDVGSPHKRSGAGRSCIRGEDGAHIWHAWRYAKRNGYLPDDDPVPYSALVYLCKERELCAVSELPDDESESIPGFAYDAALSSIQNHDDVDPGRVKTDEIEDDDGDETEDVEAILDGDADGEDTAEGEETDEHDWTDIRAAYKAATDVDERLPARYSASELLLNESSWQTIEENDTLWKYDEQAGIYRQNGEAALRTRLDETLRSQYRSQEQREIAAKIRARTTVPEQKMGGPDHKICTDNGVLEVYPDSIELHDHDPDDRFIGRLQTEYDPEADCPRFMQFLDESITNGTDKKKLQEFAGYCLMHWALPFHKALFLVGPTASGKSTWLDTIRTMIGSDAVASLTPQEMSTERFAGAELYGAWTNIRNDIPSEIIENTGKFKELVAGDPVKAEEKYSDPFKFEPKAKHMFSTNELPAASTDDRAFYRRILLVAFPHETPREDRDPRLDDKLQAEHPGVLNWALEGLQRLMRQDGFTGDRRPWETEQTWEKWSDSAKRFHQLCLEDGESDDSVPTGELWAAYLAFCQAEGIPAKSRQAQLTKELKSQSASYTTGREYVDGDRQRVMYGVQWSSRGEEFRDGHDDDAGGSSPYENGVSEY